MFTHRRFLEREQPNGPTYLLQLLPRLIELQLGPIFAGDPVCRLSGAQSQAAVPEPRFDQSHRCKSSGSLAMLAVNAGEWVGCSTLAAEARADKRCCGHRLVPGRSLQRLIGDFAAK